MGMDIEHRPVDTVERVNITGRAKVAFGAAVTGATVGALALVPAGASAAEGDPIIDYGDVTAPITGNLTAAAVVGVSIIAIVTGAILGLGFLRKMGAAKKPTG